MLPILYCWAISLKVLPSKFFGTLCLPVIWMRVTNRRHVAQVTQVCELCWSMWAPGWDNRFFYPTVHGVLCTVTKDLELFFSVWQVEWYYHSWGSIEYKLQRWLQNQNSKHNYQKSPTKRGGPHLILYGALHCSLILYVGHCSSHPANKDNVYQVEVVAPENIVCIGADRFSKSISYCNRLVQLSHSDQRIKRLFCPVIIIFRIMNPLMTTSI